MPLALINFAGVLFILGGTSILIIVVVLIGFYVSSSISYDV